MDFTFSTISFIPLPPLKNLEDLIPGFLPSAKISMPESSEKETTLNLFENVFAFFQAFSRKLFPFSRTKKFFGAPLMTTLLSGHILFISFSLFLFEDAR